MSATPGGELETPLGTGGRAMKDRHLGLLSVGLAVLRSPGLSRRLLTLTTSLTFCRAKGTPKYPCPGGICSQEGGKDQYTFGFAMLLTTKARSHKVSRQNPEISDRKVTKEQAPRLGREQARGRWGRYRTDLLFSFILFFAKKVTDVHSNKKRHQTCETGALIQGPAPPRCRLVWSLQDAGWSGRYGSFRGQPTHTAHIPAWLYISILHISTPLLKLLRY